MIPGTRGKTVEEVRVPLNDLDLFRYCASRPAPGSGLHSICGLRWLRLKTLGDVTDSTEYLVALLQNHENRSEQECLDEFRSVLRDIEARFFSSEGIVSVFDAEAEPAGAKQLALTNV